MTSAPDPLESADRLIAAAARGRRKSPAARRQALLARSVFSVSGLRLIVSGDEEDLSPDPPQEALEFAMAAAAAHADLLVGEASKTEVLLAMDTRPTGPALLSAAARIYRAKGVAVHCPGVLPLPAAMAATHRGELSGFCYFTASHNPPGHNGIKLGLADGAVLVAGLAKPLIERVRGLLGDDAAVRRLWEAAGWGREPLAPVLAAGLETARAAACHAYRDFVLEVLGRGDGPALERELRAFTAGKGLRVVCDMNGSARLLGPDLAILRDLGLEVEVLGGQAGRYDHAIVPEGASLAPCRARMQELLAERKPVLLGLAVDCDGDRGNLLLPVAGAATALKAQETFALCVLGEVADALRAGPAADLAVAANDATSLRLDRALAPFGVPVARGETGEANVLAVARELAAAGKRVPISGEGSNGGNITLPATVRDPLMTVLGLLRFLARGQATGCLERLTGAKARPGAGLAEVLAAMPAWTTTDAFEAEARMPVPAVEHEVLKGRYEQVLLAHFRKEQAFWRKIGVDGLRFVNYEGSRAIPGPGNRPAPGRGGLSVVLQRGDQDLGFLWMRGSGTEPLFRVVADWGGAPEHYPALLALHRELVGRAGG